MDKTVNITQSCECLRVRERMLTVSKTKIDTLMKISLEAIAVQTSVFPGGHVPLQMRLSCVTLF